MRKMQCSHTPVCETCWWQRTSAGCWPFILVHKTLNAKACRAFRQCRCLLSKHAILATAFDKTVILSAMPCLYITCLVCTFFWWEVGGRGSRRIRDRLQSPHLSEARVSVGPSLQCLLVRSNRVTKPRLFIVSEMQSHALMHTLPVAPPSFLISEHLL